MQGGGAWTWVQHGAGRASCPCPWVGNSGGVLLCRGWQPLCVWRCVSHTPQVEVTQEGWSLVRSLHCYVCDLRLHSAIVTENLDC